MRRLPYVIDNGQHKLADVVNQALKDHRDLAMDIATAFFNIRGYGMLRGLKKAMGQL